MRCAAERERRVRSSLSRWPSKRQLSCVVSHCSQAAFYTSLPPAGVASIISITATIACAGMRWLSPPGKVFSVEARATG